MVRKNKEIEAKRKLLNLNNDDKLYTNIEKLTEIGIKAMKFIGIAFSVMLIIDIISFIIFMFIK